MNSIFTQVFASMWLMFILPSCQIENQTRDLIDMECDSLLADPMIRSLSVAVIHKGRTYVFHKGQLVNGERPNDKTLYEIASLTKTFTGTLLAQAIAEGRMEIDEDVRTYIRGVYPNLEFSQKPMTLRHLVTHTSGLPHMFPEEPDLFKDPDWDQLPYKINHLQNGFTKASFFEELKKVQLDTVSGFKFAYSNAGANLVGYCLEEVYGKSYEQLLKEYILVPLDMNDTDIVIDEANKKFIAVGLNANGREMPFRAEKQMKAEGGIISSLEDMTKYLKFQLRSDDPVVKISHGELLNGRYDPFESGMFWQLQKTEGKVTKIHQNGGAYGTSSWLTILPQKNTGIFMATNVSAPGIHQKMNQTVEKILAQLD